MSRKTRMQDLRRAKDRRMKRIAVVGLVVLVAVLAFEIPHMLKGGGSTPTPAATTTAAGGASTTPAATTPGTTVPGTAAPASLPTTASSKLPNSDVAPVRTKSQILSFSQFSGKNPFVQQVSNQTAPAAGSPSAPTATTASTGTSGSPAKPSSSPTLSPTHAATISVNGKSQTVLINGKFPSSNPLFRLVSIANGAAKIGLVSGKFANGKSTVTLTVGQPLILIDKADGTRYKLQLLSVS
jgi:hypothetical protein